MLERERTRTGCGRAYGEVGGKEGEGGGGAAERQTQRQTVRRKGKETLLQLVRGGPLLTRLN